MTKRISKRGIANEGRPTKYKPEYDDMLIDWFDKEPYKNENGRLVSNKLPTLRDFAKSINVSWRTLHDWLNEKHASYQASFSQSYSYAKPLIKDFIVHNGLNGLYNPVFAKFVAINMTDMCDRQETNNTHRHEFPDGIQVEIVKSPQAPQKPAKSKK